MATAKAVRQLKRTPKPKRGIMRRVLRWTLAIGLIFYGWVTLVLAGLRWIDPLFTGVQVQRRSESWMQKGAYAKRYQPVPLDRISRDFQHAVIAAEDSRFFQHHGFDWVEMLDALDGDRIRGASTITQQLVKNIFFTTHRSPIRKGLEITIVPFAEIILGKRRILELYLNVVEWGPGVFGAEAAARYHYGIPAAQVGHEQGARLAAVLPSPLRRKPDRMHEYSARILSRMSKMGW